MKSVPLSDGATVHGFVTRAGTDPEMRFRFARPLPPHSPEKHVHISWSVIRAAHISLADLCPGTTVKLVAKSSTDRQGKASWSAEWVQLAPDIEPQDLQPTHLGVVDEGGVQHLQRADAWFLENVTPIIEREKVVVHYQSLSRSAQSRAELLVPGAIMMFHFDGYRISAGDLYDPARLNSNLLIEGMYHLRVMSNEQLVATVLELVRRDDHATLVPIWPLLPPEICERIISPLIVSGDLAKLGPPYPETLVTAAFRPLPTEEALTLFPGHPAAWKHPEAAVTLCSEAIANGASLDELVELCSSRGGTAKLWPLLAGSQREWIVQQASNPTVFERLKSLMSKEALSAILDALRGEDLEGKAHLVPWLSDSVLGGWLDQAFDASFEPEPELVETLVERLQHSRIRVPTALRVWGRPFWNFKDRSDLLAVIDHHHRRLLANRLDERSLALIASAIGLLLHAYTDAFNDPDQWDATPPHWVGRVIDIVRNFPVIDTQIKRFSPNYPDELAEVAFDGLPASEALTLFPNNPVAWKHAEPAFALCSEKIANGASLDQLVGLCATRGATESVWPLLGKSHRVWIVEQASDTKVFERLPSSMSEEALTQLLEVFLGEDLCGKSHLVPWLSDSVLGGWLDQAFDASFEPEPDLVEALVERLQHSRIRVPTALRVWGRPFWNAKDLSDLLAVIDHHHRRLLANRRDERSLALIAEAIGLLLHTYTDAFNDPDRWGRAPPDWVGHVIEIVRGFPEIDTEIQMRSAFGTWERQVGFQGPSRVWLHRDDLAAGWPTFAPNDKILAIYLRLSRGDAMPPEILTGHESHSMVRAFLTLIDGAKQDERSVIAVGAHDLITEAVLKRIPAPGSRAAVSPDELVIDFDRELPRCGVVRSGVQYCEGNHRSKPSLEAWQKGTRSQDLTPEMTGESDCHCPRLERARGGYRYSGCPVEMGDGHGGARLFARNELPWTRWTLLELLQQLGYPPNLIAFFKPGGTKPRVQTAKIVHNEYVNKIAAVANRINDLRDRLRCGWRDGAIDESNGCGEALSPNFSYRVFPAAYGITVFGDCTSTEAGPHDKSAYFNHCKRCLSIIDSRESPVKDDSGLNTYVCSHCGGWGQEDEGEFLKCGKCGSVESEPDGSAKTVTCRACGYEWRPPDRVWPIYRNTRP